ncbi:MAG TPA: hypothetical protein VKQ30_07305 [Ktedonobacterales bacterium]|nr:hypothetical protein [Ktedonobacterales bacterium]
MAGIAGISSPTHPRTRERAQYHDISFAVNPRHVRTLLWLRWRITVRGYTRDWRRVVGLVFGLLFILIAGGGLAAATSFAFTSLPYHSTVEVLFGVLAFLYGAWAVLPLLQYSLNEGLDVTKLQSYPVTRGEQMVSLVLSTLLDVSTLFILALFAAILVGWHATPIATAFTVVALALAYIHIVGFSQLILAALMGLLRSRRYRDLTVVLFALLGSSCWLLDQLFFSHIDNAFGLAHTDLLSTLHLERFLQYTPPGMAAQAILNAGHGNILVASGWLLMLALLVPVLLVIWARVLDHSITSAETASAATARPRRVRRPISTAPVTLATDKGSVSARLATRARHVPLSGAALAIAAKDLRYLWRDPQLKAALLSSLAPILLVFLPNLYASSSPHSSPYLTQFDVAGPFGVLFAPLPALLIVLVLAINAFGLERQGLQTLFLFPIRPLDIFWGKNLAIGVLAYTMEIVLTLIKAAITGGWFYVPLALIGGLAALLAMLGIGNVTSVLFPFRSRQMRMGDASSFSSENGCLRSVISTSTLFLAILLLLPVATAVLMPLAIHKESWLVFTLPFALSYGTLLYQVPTRIIAPVFVRRGPEILHATVPDA